MSAWEAFKKFYRVFRWVVLIGMLIVFFMALKTASPPPVRTDPGASESVRFKVHQAQQAVDAGESHTLELDEPEVNAMLQSSLQFSEQASAVAAAVEQAESGQPAIEDVKTNVRDIKLLLEGDTVKAYVLFNFHGKDLSLILEGTLHAADGYLRMQPTSGALGSLPIPQATLDNAARRLFDSQENREKFRLPAHVRDVRVENGRVKVFYYQ